MKTLSLVEVERAYALVNGDFKYETGSEHLFMTFSDNANKSNETRYSCLIEFASYPSFFDRYNISADSVTSLVQRVNKILTAIDWCPFYE